MLTNDHDYMKTKIRDSLSLKETDELLDIWRQADHEEWTDLAFEVVHEILLERLGEIPERKPKMRTPWMMKGAHKPQEEVQAPAAGEIRSFVRQQIYESLDELSTDEVLDIWQKADHEQWTDEAFEVMQQILMERIGRVPAREAEEPEIEETDEEDATPRPTEFLAVKPAGEDPLPFAVLDGLVGMHCPDCGKGISEKDRNCPHCGVDLEAPLSETELETLGAEQLEKAGKSFDLGRNFKQALAECDEALEYLPHSAQAHNLRGLILDALNKTGLAIREYKEALRLDPALTEARDNLADAETELRAQNS